MQGIRIYINARGDSLSTRVGKGRWYLVQIGSGSTLQRDFIPVRRDSDNAVGMWDMVTKTFFENAGTGSFTAGPVAQ